MAERSEVPRYEIGRDKALTYTLLTVNRMQLHNVPGFDAWRHYEPDADPLVIYDLNGTALFYDFTFAGERGQAGIVRASAHQSVGSPVVSIQLGPRSWNPDEATKRARALAKEKLPKSRILRTEFVCYSYPKIGVRVYLNDPQLGRRSLILDVGSYALVERLGTDELEGFCAWSFLEAVSVEAQIRQRRWEMAEEELELVRGRAPQLLEPGLTLEVERILPQLIAEDFLYPIPFVTSRVITYGPRCTPHACFELYAQQTDYYCAVATGQMILDFYRYYFTQDQIATAMSTTTGGTDNANQVQGYQQLSKNCLVATYDDTATWNEAKAEIDSNRPLKSGIWGHARACAGYMKQNIYLIGVSPKTWLRIYDPWPWNADICAGGAVVWEDWDSIVHTNFIYVRHRTTACS